MRRDRLEYLHNHTKKKYAPCIVDKKPSFAARSSLLSILARLLTPFTRSGYLQEMAPPSWSIIHTFLKSEPRFRHLPRVQQWKVLLLAIRYRQTVLALMRLAVDRYESERINE